MTTTESNSLRFELLSSNDYAHYIQREPREIRFILRTLIERRAMISAYFGPTGDFLLTAILRMSDDETSLYLDWGADDAINARVENSDLLTCATQLDRVRIQFDLKQVRQSTLAGAKVFLAPVPDAMLRLQRREYYRLTTPATHGVTCSVLVGSDGPDASRVEAKVLDISGGGLAVMVPPVGTPFEPDREFHHCRITLPEIGTIEARMRVCSVFRISAANGKPMLRAGCQFIKLPDSKVSMIQRYILRVERERNTRGR